MTVRIIAIYIVVVVLPIPCTSIVRWVYINAVNLAAIEIYKQLQRMIVIRLYQCMPQFTIRSVTHTIYRFETGIDRLAKLSNSYQIFNRKRNTCVLIIKMLTFCNTVFNGQHLIVIPNVSIPFRHSKSTTYREFI